MLFRSVRASAEAPTAVALSIGHVCCRSPLYNYRGATRISTKSKRKRETRAGDEADENRDKTERRKTDIDDEEGEGREKEGEKAKKPEITIVLPIGPKTSTKLASKMIGVSDHLRRQLRRRQWCIMTGDNDDGLQSSLIFSNAPFCGKLYLPLLVSPSEGCSNRVASMMIFSMYRCSSSTGKSLK